MVCICSGNDDYVRNLLGIYVSYRIGSMGCAMFYDAWISDYESHSLGEGISLFLYSNPSSTYDIDAGDSA